MIHIIYIYLIINSFILGSYLLDRFNDYSLIEKVFWSVILFFFGGILLPLIYIGDPLVKVIGYIYKEIKFQYRFHFTDFWDKILLDDNYSEDYKTLGEKLKRAELMIKSGSKQLKRHNKQIQKKYGKD